MGGVFLSYRHENDAHQARVRALAVRLISNGFVIVLDQISNENEFHGGGPNDGWPRWSKTQAGNPEHCVLIVASAGWIRCYEGKETPGVGLGAAAEAAVIEQRLYNSGGISQDIRVVRFAGHVEPLPLDLQRYQTFRIPEDEAELIRWLSSKGTGQGIDQPQGTEPETLSQALAAIRAVPVPKYAMAVVVMGILCALALSSFFFDAPVALRRGKTASAHTAAPQTITPAGDPLTLKARPPLEEMIAVTRKRSRDLAEAFRDKLFARFGPSGWAVTDSNWKGIDPWTQMPALASVLFGPVSDARSIKTAETALDAVHRTRGPLGWQSDTRSYFNVEPPLFATLAFCRAKASKLSFPREEPMGVWHISEKYRDASGGWKEASAEMDIPSVYATGVATLAMLECLNAGALAPAAVEEKLDSAINWLFLNQRQSSGLLSWKPDELAVSSSKGVTVFTSYVLLRASKQLGLQSHNVDFRKALPPLLRSMSNGAGELLANDSYVFAPTHKGKTAFSHSVRFLHNPWTMACISEWLRQYGATEPGPAENVIDVWEHILTALEHTDPNELQSWQIAEFLLALNLAEA